MCYDRQKSLIALFINIISSIYVFYYAKNNNQIKAISLFFIYVGFMQFWDTIFLSYDATTKINIYSTKLAMIWNHLEPIILALLIFYIIGPLTLLSKITIIVYTVVILIYSFNIWNKLNGTEVTKESCDSLYWQWNNMDGSTFVYFLFLLCLIILSQQFTGWIKWLGILIMIITFLFSLYKYRINGNSGRFWCYFVSFSSIFFIIGNHIF